MRKKCFILVGHSHWGKSKTLEALTGKDLGRHLKIEAIDEQLEAYVRRISNDDDEDALLKFSADLALRIKQDYLILTFCPKISASEKCQAILSNLKSVYDLYFFVLMENYQQTLHITDEEIALLEKYSPEIQRLYGHHEQDERSKQFADYISKKLR
jgi:hypothetical protein